MTKFLIQIGLFFLLIFMIDVAAGSIFPYMVNHAIGGDNGRNNNICNKIVDDILVFGSSKAIHHYNPLILSDSLGLTCYNCGQDGSGAISNYGRYHLVCQRYHPKLLIYDIHPGFDLLTGEDNHKYLGWLRAYYDRQGISEVFESVDSMEKYKMLSQMYRYNTKFIQIVSDYINPLQSDGVNGFRPIDKEMNTLRISNKARVRTDFLFDQLKISYIEKIIDESEDTKIVFVVSPHWSGMDTLQFKPIKEICQRRNIPFVDFSNNPKYVHANKYFCDGSHLNVRGADEFSRDLIAELRRRDILSAIK